MSEQITVETIRKAAAYLKEQEAATRAPWVPVIEYQRVQVIK